MVKILEITDLSYQNFNDLDLSFDSGNFYSIVGPNNSGKTTLFNLITCIIPTSNVISLNNIILNKDNIDKYIVNIGIVERVNKNSFIYTTAINEMIYPLSNLGYSKKEALRRINEVLELFSCTNFLDKKISELNFYDKQLLLIMIALLHKPKILLLDSVLQVFSKSKQEDIIKILKKLIQEDLTVISFTNYLTETYYSDKILLLDNFNIVGEYNYSDIFKDDKVFYEHNLEIPFMTDLSIKLKMYGLVDKEYINMKEMVDDIWP